MSGVPPGWYPNVEHNNSWTLYLDTKEHCSFFWAVQSQDGSYSRSEWSAEMIIGYDPDNDGVYYSCDICPNEFDPEQIDTDNDGIGDICDNCPNVTNPDQLDSDGDGTGDACENRAPTANAGSSQTVTVGNSCMATVNLDGSGSNDPDGDLLTYLWIWELGSASGVQPTVELPLGTHTITLFANDGKLNSTPDTVDITVIDDTPSEISLSVNPDILWPPNHKMVPIEVDIMAADNCDASPNIKLVSITMNEGDETSAYEPDYDDTLGDGHTYNDIVVENGNIFLRAERSGTGVGRFYTITYEAIDASGNSDTENVTVVVPHSQK